MMLEKEAKELYLASLASSASLRMKCQVDSVHVCMVHCYWDLDEAVTLLWVILAFHSSIYNCFLLKMWLTTSQWSSFVVCWPKDVCALWRDFFLFLLLLQGDEESSDTSDGAGNHSQGSWCYKSVNANVLRMNQNTLPSIASYMIYVWASYLVTKLLLIVGLHPLRIWTSRGPIRVILDHFCPLPPPRILATPMCWNWMLFARGDISCTIMTFPYETCDMLW